MLLFAPSPRESVRLAGEQRVAWTIVAGLFLLVSVMLGTAVVASIPVGIGLDRVDRRRATGLATLALVVAGATAVLGVTLGWFAPEPTPRTG